jgi:8-oxo-dGTP pyrophosphatase MutT (NUDIX family)
MTSDQLLRLLENHTSTFQAEQRFIQQTSIFIKNHTNFYQRSNLAGHVTGSAWILSPDFQSTLLIHHRKLEMWFQPGGHVDPTDQTIAKTAEREAREETGLGQLDIITDRIFDVDIHEIPARKEVPKHLHYDIRILCIAKDTTIRPSYEEVKGIKWLNIKEALEDQVNYPTVHRMLLKSLNIKEFITDKH